MLSSGCFVLTMGGGAVSDQSPQRFPNREDSSCSPPVRSGGGATTRDWRPQPSSGLGGYSPAAACDAGTTRHEVAVVGPTRKGPVDRFLAVDAVRQGVATILAAVAAKLPGYKTILEVVTDPSEGDEGAYLMVSVCMDPDDQRGADVVEGLIDEQWLSLAPEVRRALGVGRELVQLG